MKCENFTLSDKLDSTHAVVSNLLAVPGPAKGLQMARMSYENTMMRESPLNRDFFRAVDSVCLDRRAVYRGRDLEAS